MRHDLGPIEMVFFRNLFGVVFIISSLIKRPPSQTGGKLGLLIFRGVIGTLALYTFFYGVTKIGLAVSISYQQSYPIFLAVFGSLFLNEKLLPREWFAVFIGFLGVVLIFFPQISMDSISPKANVLGIANAIMTGSAYLSIRGLRKYYDTRTIVLSFMATGIILPIFSILVGSNMDTKGLDFLFESFVMPHGATWLWLFLLGLTALIGQIYLTKAFTHERTGIIAAVGYSNIVFSVLFGILLLDPIPSITTFFGIGMVILCGVLLARKKKD
jgi:drug/metabolite transporter (DMT)-like permease